MNSYDLGLYATNYSHPFNYNWEIGISLIKWQIGLELYR